MKKADRVLEVIFFILTIWALVNVVIEWVQGSPPVYTDASMVVACGAMCVLEAHLADHN